MRSKWKQISAAERKAIESSGRLGSLGPLARWGKRFVQRLTGSFSFEDQIKIACMCEPDWFFLRHGIMIPHAYGITLSIDQIGADCLIGQNVTIGTNGRDMAVGDTTTGHKPRIGRLVRLYAGSTVSGPIEIGDCVVVAAQAFVSRPVPPFSIVYGHNKIIPLRSHHIHYLRQTLHLAVNSYNLTAGLSYEHGRLFIDPEYAAIRAALLGDIEMMGKCAKRARLV
jgi:serine acetyltransferase